MFLFVLRSIVLLFWTLFDKIYQAEIQVDSEAASRSGGRLFTLGAIFALGAIFTRGAIFARGATFARGAIFALGAIFTLGATFALERFSL